MSLIYNKEYLLTEHKKNNANNKNPQLNHITSLRDEISKELGDRKLFYLQQRFDTCGTTYYNFECESCGKNWYVPFSCGLPTCSHCADKWAIYHRRNVLRAIKPIVYNGSPTKRRIKHLVLTFRTNSITPPLIKHTNKCAKRFFRTMFRTKGFYANQYGKRIHKENRYYDRHAGGIHVIDIKDRHLHIHFILWCSFIPIQQIAATWKRITSAMGQPSQISYINGDGRSLAGLVCYVIKPMAFSDPQLAVDAIVALRRRRRIVYHGSFFQARKFKQFMDSLKRNQKRCPFCNSSNFVLKGTIKKEELLAEITKWRGPPDIANEMFSFNYHTSPCNAF